MSDLNHKKSFSEVLKSYFDVKLFSTLMPYFKQYRYIISISLILIILSEILAVLTPILLQQGIDVYIIGKMGRV